MCCEGIKLIVTYFDMSLGKLRGSVIRSKFSTEGPTVTLITLTIQLFVCPKILTKS